MVKSFFGRKDSPINMAYRGSGDIPTSHDSNLSENGVCVGPTTRLRRYGSWELFLQMICTECEADSLKLRETHHEEIFHRALETLKDEILKDVQSGTIFPFGTIVWEQCSYPDTKILKCHMSEMLPVTSPIGHTISAQFRAMHFHRFDKPGRNRFDFVARLATSSDFQQSLKESSVASLSCENNLPVWRNSPLNTVAVITLLTGPNIDVDAAVRQVAHFCECPLRVTPNRKVVFGVATNFQVCVFVAVVVSGEGPNREYSTYHTGLIEKDVFEQLVKFATTSPEAMGVRWRFPTSLFEPTKFLGKGSTSWAMSGIWRGQELVMKLSVRPTALEVERQLLAYLHRCDDALFSCCIPKIHAEAQTELYPHCQEACSVFKKRYELDAPLTKAHILELWAILCKLHQYGVVHRDIRSPNVAMCTGAAGNTDFASSNAVCNVVLIDFSSAKLYTTTTCTTTAEEVMQRFQQANNGVQLSSLQGKWETRPVSTSSDAVLRGADTLPADEACALIHCTMQENFSEVMALFAINMEGGNYERFLKRRGGDCFWRDLATIDPIVDTLIETIRRALGNLQAIRESCTEAQRTAEVQAAVAAVFRLRPLIPKC